VYFSTVTRKLSVLTLYCVHCAASKCLIYRKIHQTQSETNFANANGLTFFNPRAHEGLLRTLMLRTSSTGEIMVLIQFFENDKVNRELILDHLYESSHIYLFAICGQQ
jgi:hypothetical protein